MHDPVPAPAHADVLFARWCRREDVLALGELFDLLAPRLQRLAVHLVGDAAEAEDLVQATFLTAIERRKSADASRPVLPWLTGVLAHKVSQHRRRAARFLDPARLARAEVEDPSRPLERRELAGEVARAIDALEEPYRQVLLLRVRHGLAPADIAHVLERDPGTVRVQLHRGLERLRQTLPSALVATLVCATCTPRGLAAVKAAVLEGAAASPSALVIGGVLMGKKLGIALVCAVVATTLFWVQSSSEGPRRDDTRRASVPGEVPAADDLVATTTLQANASSDVSSGAREDAARSESRHVSRGRVLDLDTTTPLAGARVALYPPRTTTTYALQRDFRERFEVDAKGAVRPIGNGDWPRVAGAPFTVSSGQILCFDCPRPGETPLGETVTDAAGAFELALERDGVIEVSREGYVTRWRVARTGQQDLEIALGRGREVKGRVLGPGDEPLRAIDLVLTGFRPMPWQEPQSHGSDEPGPRLRATVLDEETTARESFGSWAARTDEDGRFRATMSAPFVEATVTTPGWLLTKQAVHPVGEEEIQLEVQRHPALHVFDAKDRSPIERIRLLGNDIAGRRVRWSGEFHAPEGHLDLPGPSFMVAQSRGTHVFTVWSDGYSPARVSVLDVAAMGTIEVPLERGSTPRLQGIVTRAGRPIEGAEVALLGHSPTQWGVDADQVVDVIRTDARGGFVLVAPEGSYLVRIRVDDAPFIERVSFIDKPNYWNTRAIEGREPFFQVADVPGDTALVIDLATASTLEVEIVDSNGVPRAEHIVALRGPRGRQLVRHTASDGLVRFANLPAGSYRVHTPLVTTIGSFSGGELRDVELGPGRTERVRIEIPALDRPRHARVVCADVVSYEGWRARYDADDWQPLAADGTVPMDLLTHRSQLEVVSPEGRHWHVAIPKSASDGHEIELDAGSGRYRGVLRWPDGHPWASVAVLASPTNGGPSAVGVSTVTDTRGEFELAGLGPGPYRLWFQTQVKSTVWNDLGNALASVSFEPARPPDEEGPWLDIRTQVDGEPIRIAGVVEDERGAPLANASLSFEREMSSPDGCLRSGGQSHRTVTDEHGAFELELPRAPQLTVWVHSGDKSWPVQIDTLEGLPSHDALRLVVR
jgi:RNA polymerase sigma-70 factor (ECF subfamily)